MKDLYNTNVEFGGSWVLDGAVLTLAGGDELLVNSIAIQYGRPLQKMFGLNTAKQFLVAGRGSGSIQLGIIIGPSKGVKTFIDRYSDACKVSENTIEISPTSKQCSEGNENMKFTASFALIQSISMQAQSGDLAIVSAGCQLMIGGLSIK